MSTKLCVATGGLLRTLSGATPTTTPPSPPSIIGITAGDAQVTVRYAAPVSDGGSPILSYTVSVTPGTHVISGITPTVFSQIVTGLVNGTSYTATVTAANALGSSTSTPSAVVIPTVGVVVKPSASTTGVPVGAPGDTRTPFPGGFSALTLVDGANGVMPAALTGKMTWDSANKAYRLNAANQTYDGYNFVGRFLANANQLNLAFTRCYFNASLSNVGCFVPNGHTWGSLTFIDCEYNGNGPSDGRYDSSAGPYGVFSNQSLLGPSAPTDSFTLTRCNLYGGVDNIDIPSCNVSITRCYIHDNTFYWSSSGVDTHSDPTQVFTSASATYTATVNATTTLTVSGAAPFGVLSVGQLVIGTGIPTGTTVASVTNSTTIVMSAGATTSGSTSIYLVPPVRDVLVQYNYISGNTASTGINSALQMGGFGAGTTITNFQYVDNWIDGPRHNTAFTGGVGTLPVSNSTIDRNRLGLATYAVRNPSYNSIWGPNNVWDASGTTAGGAVVVAGQAIP